MTKCALDPYDSILSRIFPVSIDKASLSTGFKPRNNPARGGLKMAQQSHYLAYSITLVSRMTDIFISPARRSGPLHQASLLRSRFSTGPILTNSGPSRNGKAKITLMHRCPAWFS